MVSKFARNTSRASTLEYCTKTAVYGAILEQNARFRPIYGSLRRSVMIDLGSLVIASTVFIVQAFSELILLYQIKNMYINLLSLQYFVKLLLLQCYW